MDLLRDLIMAKKKAKRERKIIGRPSGTQDKPQRVAHDTPQSAMQDPGTREGDKLYCVELHDGTVKFILAPTNGFAIELVARCMGAKADIYEWAQAAGENVLISNFLDTLKLSPAKRMEYLEQHRRSREM